MTNLQAAPPFRPSAEPGPYKWSVLFNRMATWAPPGLSAQPYFPDRPYDPFPASLRTIDINRIDKSIRRKLFDSMAHALPACHEISLLEIARARSLLAERGTPEALAADPLLALLAVLYRMFCMEDYLKHPLRATPREARRSETARKLRDHTMAMLVANALEYRKDHLTSDGKPPYTYAAVFGALGADFNVSPQKVKQAYLHERKNGWLE